MTSKELIKILAVKDITLKKWRGESSYRKAQISPKPQGGIPVVYDLPKLQTWLYETGRNEYAERLQSHISPKDVPPKEKPDTVRQIKEEQIRPDDQKQKKAFDIFQATEQVGQMFQITRSRMGKKVMEGDSQISAETTSISKFAAEYRNMTQACIEIDKDLRKIVLVSDVEKWMGRIFSKVKTDMLSLPYAAADQLAGMTEPDAIAKFLRVKIEDALRHMASDIKDMKV